MDSHDGKASNQIGKRRTKSGAHLSRLSPCFEAFVAQTRTRASERAQWQFPHKSFDPLTSLLQTLLEQSSIGKQPAW
jgi:hypothetical protein